MEDRDYNHKMNSSQWQAHTYSEYLLEESAGASTKLINSSQRQAHTFPKCLATTINDPNNLETLEARAIDPNIP